MDRTSYMSFDRRRTSSIRQSETLVSRVTDRARISHQRGNKGHVLYNLGRVPPIGPFRACLRTYMYIHSCTNCLWL